MLVEDPRETLETLCFFRDSDVDKDTFVKKYEEVIGRTYRPIHEKNGHTHFYSLTTFKLLTKTNYNKYHLSVVAKELCEYLKDPAKIEDFQNLLSDVLKTNETKGDLFEEFLRFLRVKKTKKEISEKFKGTPARTLIAWSKLAGLIIQDGQIFQSIPQKKKKTDSNTFKKILIEYYKKSENSDIFGIQRLFIPIHELRDDVCIKLGISPEVFDKFLTELLETDFGSNISLHGGTTKAYEKKGNQTFKYHNKIYLLISLRGE
jgi:hypothetical protein